MRTKSLTQPLNNQMVCGVTYHVRNRLKSAHDKYKTITKRAFFLKTLDFLKTTCAFSLNCQNHMDQRTLLSSDHLLKLSKTSLKGSVTCSGAHLMGFSQMYATLDQCRLTSMRRQRKREKKETNKKKKSPNYFKEKIRRAEKS